jgi:MFS transporter, ACS family, allantoate permease
MADMEKSHELSSDPEKVTELGRNVTYGDGEVQDPMFVHADPNDGDEACVIYLFSNLPQTCPLKDF